MFTQNLAFTANFLGRFTLPRNNSVNKMGVVRDFGAGAMGGIGIAFYVLAAVTAADVIVSYIPSPRSGERRTLTGWVTGVIS